MATDLQRLHGLYVDFMTAMARERQQEVHRPPYTYAEFVVWWGQLDPSHRELCTRDFLMGYQAVLKDAEQQVAAVVERYKC